MGSYFVQKKAHSWNTQLMASRELHVVRGDHATDNSQSRTEAVRCERELTGSVSRRSSADSPARIGTWGRLSDGTLGNANPMLEWAIRTNHTEIAALKQSGERRRVRRAIPIHR